MLLHKLISGLHLGVLLVCANVVAALSAFRRPRMLLREWRQVCLRLWLGVHACLRMEGKFRVTRIVKLCRSSGVSRATLERNIEAAVALAEHDIGWQRYDQAVAVLTPHIDANPNHPKIAKCLGLRSLVHAWRGHQREAIDDLTRCAALRPRYARGFRYFANLAQLHGIRGEVPEARRAMAGQLKAKPGDDPSEYLVKRLTRRTRIYTENIPHPQTLGVFFGAYHNALGHAILDPFSFYNLFRHRFDHLMVLHPALVGYARAPSLMTAVMQQYVDQIDVPAEKFCLFPWQNLGELSAGRVSFLCYNYWALNRMSYHARRDPTHPMHAGRRYLELPPKIVDRAELVCRKNGLDISRPIVVLHTRSHGYHGLSVQSFRNVGIENYIPAVRRLVELGYAVVRIGDKRMPSLKAEVPEIIELPFLEHYDHALDLYFLSRCRFMISCQSGPCSLARALGKPNLVVNAVYHYTMLPEVNEVLLFKQYRNAGGSVLSLEELLARGCHLFDRSSHFEDARVELENATADEILAATEEMLASLDKANRLDTPSQAACRELMLRTASAGPNWHPFASAMTDYIGYALPEGRVSDAVCRLRSGYVSAASQSESRAA